MSSLHGMRVGVIGAGAMGMGVVKSLHRAGVAVSVRDIRKDAEDEAAALGAQRARAPSDVAEACDASIILVVDDAQVDAVLFGDRGIAHAKPREHIVAVSSTLDPDYVSSLVPRLPNWLTLIDAPVSGGPKRAADGTMTLMVSGPSAALDTLAPLFDCIAANVFRVGERAGDAARFKIVNNLLAAANLAAAAEALSVAVKAGLDAKSVVDVINASSGASWILADRVPRALGDDPAVRAAAKILAKDARLAVDFAERVGVDCRFARAARDAFRALVDREQGELDDAVILVNALGR